MGRLSKRGELRGCGRHPAQSPLPGHSVLVPWSPGENVLKKHLKDGCETNIEKIEKRKRSSSWLEQVGEEEGLTAGMLSQSLPQRQDHSGGPPGAGQLCWDGHQSPPVMGTDCHVCPEQPESHTPVKG